MIARKLAFVAVVNIVYCNTFSIDFIAVLVYIDFYCCIRICFASIVLIFLFCSNPVRYSNYYTYIQLRINKCDNNIKQEDHGYYYISGVPSKDLVD